MRSLFAVPEPAGALGEAGGAIAIRVDGLPIKELNRIAGLYDLSELDALTDVFEGRQYWITLDPEARLDEELVARGYVRDGAWQKFVRDVRPVDARTDLDVTDARSAADISTFLRAAWNVPPAEADWLSLVAGDSDWHCFIAYEGQEPVAGGMLYTSGGAGWLGVAATRIEYRGRGAQSALLAARIDRARRIGLELVVTETGAPEHGEPGPSYRNILRAGFEPAYVRPNYTASGAGSSSSSGSRP